MESVEMADNVASTSDHPPHETCQLPSTTSASVSKVHHLQSGSSFDSVAPSGISNRVQHDTKDALNEDAPSASPISIRGSSDGVQPVTPSAANDTYLSPLMQWHKQQIPHSRSLDSTWHPLGPSTTSLFENTRNSTQYQPPPWPLHHNTVPPIGKHYIQPCQGTYARPPVGHYALPAEPRTFPSHPTPQVGYYTVPTKPRIVPFHSTPPVPVISPTRVVNERPANVPYTSPYSPVTRTVNVPYTSPYSPVTHEPWKQLATNHGLHGLATVATYGTPSSVNRPADYDTFSAGADVGPALNTPTSSPYPMSDADDTTRSLPQTPSKQSTSASLVPGGQGMQGDDSPGQGHKDEDTIRKQDEFRRKAEIAKERRRNIDANKTPKKRTRKRKLQLGEFSSAVQQTVAPIMVDTLNHGLPDPYTYSSNSAFYDPYRQGQGYQSHANAPDSQYSMQSSSQDYILGQGYTYRPPDYPRPPSATDPDEIYQPITTEYSNYRWSARLYKIDQDKTGHQYAESWIVVLLDALGGGIKQHTHVTEGFIDSGDQFTFLVLHNAADPFRYGRRPAFTVSIGCYGFHWYDHSDIRWTTLAIDLRYSFGQFVLDGLISEVKKWHPLMEKAKERRFHRAYWLAASMSPLRTILNRRLDETVIKRVEEIEDLDDGFKLTKLDLNNDGCELSTHEAERRWEECQEIAESEVEGHTPEHIVTGSSEYSL